MTTTYEAILQAADHIGSHPADFNFMAQHIPTGCGSPGCALGWIGYFAKIKPVAYYSFADVAHDVLRLGLESKEALWRYGAAHEFYDRIGDICKEFGLLKSDWMFNATACAMALREYAEKYHAPKSAIPTPILAIFNVPEAVS